MTIINTTGGFSGFGRHPVPKPTTSITIDPAVNEKTIHNFDIDGDLIIVTGNTQFNSPTSSFSIRSTKSITIGIALWGGGGGNVQTFRTGGPGGLAMGYLGIEANQEYKIELGQAGIHARDSRFSGGGGSATIFYSADNANNPIAVAGGGGGAPGYSGNDLISTLQRGHGGGGLVPNVGIPSVTVPHWKGVTNTTIPTAGSNSQKPTPEEFNPETSLWGRGGIPPGLYRGGDGGGSVSSSIGREGPGGGGYPLGGQRGVNERVTIYGSGGGYNSYDLFHGGQGGQNFSNISTIKTYNNAVGWTSLSTDPRFYTFTTTAPMLDHTKAQNNVVVRFGGANIGGLARIWLYEHTAVGFTTDLDTVSSTKIITTGTTENGARYKQIKILSTQTFTITNPRPTDSIEILSVGSGGNGGVSIGASRGGEGGDAGKIVYAILPALEGTYTVTVGETTSTSSPSFVTAPNGQQYAFAAGGANGGSGWQYGQPSGLPEVKNLFSNFGLRDMQIERLGGGGGVGLDVVSGNQIIRYPGTGYGAGGGSDDAEPNTGAGGGAGYYQNEAIGLGGSGVVFVRYCYESGGSSEHEPKGSALIGTYSREIFTQYKVENRGTTFNPAGTESWEIEFWIWPSYYYGTIFREELSSDNVWDPLKRIDFIDSLGQPGVNEMELGTGNRTNKLGIAVFFSRRRSSYYYDVDHYGYLSEATISPRNWHHVRISHNIATGSKIFIDGTDQSWNRTARPYPSWINYNSNHTWPWENGQAFRWNIGTTMWGYLHDFKYTVSAVLKGRYFTNHTDVYKGEHPDWAKVTNDPITNPYQIKASTVVPGEYAPITEWSLFFRNKRSATVEFPTSLNNSTQFGTENFTIEFWVRPVLSPPDRWTTILAIGINQAGKEIRIGQNIDSQFGFLIPNNTNSGPTYARVTTPLSLKVWTHIALVRNSSKVSMYTNGSLLVELDDIQFNFTTNGNIRLGYGFYSSDTSFAGYLSNLRILKGTALYTEAPFEVPTAPLEAIDTTVLLTAKTNPIVDESPNNYTPTISGDVNVSSFGPFNLNYLE